MALLHQYILALSICVLLTSLMQLVKRAISLYITFLPALFAFASVAAVFETVIVP